MGSQQGDARSGAGARPGPAGCERAPLRRPLGLGRRLRARAPPRYGPCCCGAEPAAAAAGSQAPSLHVRLARHRGRAAPAGGGRSGGRARRAAERGRSASPSRPVLRPGRSARPQPRAPSNEDPRLPELAAGAKPPTAVRRLPRPDRHTSCQRGLPAPRAAAAPSSTRRNPRQHVRAPGVTQQSQQLRIRGSTGRFDRRRPPFLAVMRVAGAYPQPN